MADDVRVDTEELRRLGAAFQEQADELGRRLTHFRRRADGAALRGAVGGGPEAGRRAELYTEAERVLVGLQQRLGEVGHGLEETARSHHEAEEALAHDIEALREAR